jgi:maleamate amidohydrolase
MTPAESSRNRLFSGQVRAGVPPERAWAAAPFRRSPNVGDRHDGPHDANLFDINDKYGDVMSKAEVSAHLESMRIVPQAVV